MCLCGGILDAGLFLVCASTSAIIPGLGTARSLEAYFRESGINVKQKKVGEHCG